MSLEPSVRRLAAKDWTPLSSAEAELQDAINYCKWVAEMGDKVNPGSSLNPATKARVAVREAVRHLAAMKDDGA